MDSIISNNDHDHHSGILLIGFDHILDYKVTMLFLFLTLDACSLDSILRHAQIL